MPRAPSPGPWGHEGGTGELEPSRCPGQLSSGKLDTDGGLHRWNHLMTEQRPWGRRADVELVPMRLGVSLNVCLKTPGMEKVWVDSVATNEWRCH